MPPLSRRIDQLRIIDNLNQYLKWNNLPVRMNEGGICNGLASVYAKYALEKKEEQFFSLLEYIAGNEISPEEESKVNHFAVEIITSFSPSIFNPSISPLHSSEALAINNKPLKASFNFGTTTSKKNWMDIINKIDLKENEVMRVVGADHAICISKKDGLYRIYDPNYSWGLKEFKNEDELIQEIYNNNFQFIWGELSMGISVIPHPESPPREFPKIVELHNHYPESTGILKKPFSLFSLFNSDYFSALKSAAMWNDGEVVRHLADSPEKCIEASMTATQYNNINALRVLIPTIKNDQVILDIFITALSRGYEAIVDELLKNDHNQNIINQTIIPKGAIHLAAGSGNLSLIKKIMDKYKLIASEKNNPEDISAKIVEEHAILIAILGGSAQCVKYFVDQLTEHDKLTEEQILSYLKMSIRINSRELTSYFLESLSAESVKKLDMRQQDLRTIDSIDLSILQQLKKAGVQFSENGDAIIAEKEHKSVGFFVSLDISLSKFTEFIKSKLPKIFKPSVNDDAINKCNEFRKQLVKVITLPNQPEENSNSKNPPKSPPKI